MNVNVTVRPKPSAYAEARLGGLVAGGMVFAIGLGALILALVHVAKATLSGGWLFSAIVMSGGLVLGWLFYALQAPSVLTVDMDVIRLDGPLIHRRVSAIDVQEIVRGRTGKARMRAYLIVRTKGAWLGLGNIVIDASQYDQAEVERLIAATGRPVNGDFTEHV